jgi:hypothetical protein
LISLCEWRPARCRRQARGGDRTARRRLFDKIGIVLVSVLPMLDHSQPEDPLVGEVGLDHDQRQDR